MREPHDDVVLDLVKDLEQWNTPEARIEAARKLKKIGQPNRLVLDRLQAAVKDCYHQELKAVLTDTIEALQMTSHVKRARAGVPTMTTGVSIEELDGSGLLVDGGKAIRRCGFCGKDTLLTPSVRAYSDAMSSGDRFFCTFCLRHRLHHRDHRHVLMMTFRGIIGYYYQAFYALPKQALMYISEIRDYVDLHVKAGLENPLFNYDPDSYVWFVDFSRVGRGKGRQPIEEVLLTVSRILLTFNLFEHVKDIRPYKVYQKYQEAIQIFFHKRQRPEGQRLLAPTLIKTGAGDTPPERSTGYTYNDTSKRKINFEETRNFHPAILTETVGLRP